MIKPYLKTAPRAFIQSVYTPYDSTAKDPFYCGDWKYLRVALAYVSGPQTQVTVVFYNLVNGVLLQAAQTKRFYVNSNVVEWDQVIPVLGPYVRVQVVPAASQVYALEVWGENGPIDQFPRITFNEPLAQWNAGIVTGGSSDTYLASVWAGEVHWRILHQAASYVIQVVSTDDSGVDSVIDEARNFGGATIVDTPRHIFLPPSNVRIHIENHDATTQIFTVALWPLLDQRNIMP